MVEFNGLMHQPDPHGEGDFRPGRRPRPSVLATQASRAIDNDAKIASMSRDELLAGIERMRRSRRAMILAHNYQIPDIQDLADFVGDSLELSREAAKTDASVIAFCGVHFMAETAAIFCPNKRVLIPDTEAGCSLAASVTADEIRRWRGEHPKSVVVAYVNTNAAVKAEADFCCTSANAVEIVKSIPVEQRGAVPARFVSRSIRRAEGRSTRAIVARRVPCPLRNLYRRRSIIAEPLPRRRPSPTPGVWVRERLLYALASGESPAARSHVLGTGGMVRDMQTCDAPGRDRRNRARALAPLSETGADKDPSYRSRKTPFANT